MRTEDSRQESAHASRPRGILRVPVVGPAWSLYRSYTRRNGPLLSAGIAYYGLFSTLPLALLTVSIAGAFVGPYTARESINEALSAYLGPNMAGGVTDLLVELRGDASTTVTVIGWALLLYGAIRLFLRLQTSFNAMWDVRVIPGKMSVHKILSRLLVFAMILAPSILMGLAFALSGGISWLTGALGTDSFVLQVAEALVPLAASWVALMVVFAVLPDVRLSLRDVWLGALLAAVFCALGTRAFGFYLEWSGNQRYTGTIGSVIALIVWVNFMAMIMLLGVRLNGALLDRKGKVARPYRYAVAFRDELLDETDASDLEDLAVPANGVRTAEESVIDTVDAVGSEDFTSVGESGSPE